MKKLFATLITISTMLIGQQLFAKDFTFSLETLEIDNPSTNERYDLMVELVFRGQGSDLSKLAGHELKNISLTSESKTININSNEVAEAIEEIKKQNEIADPKLYRVNFLIYKMKKEAKVEEFMKVSGAQAFRSVVINEQNAPERNELSFNSSDGSLKGTAKFTAN